MVVLIFLVGMNIGDAVRMLNETCLEPYISPVMRGFLMGLNTNLYHTGRSHALLGGDVSLSLSFVTIPDKYDYATYKVLKWNSSALNFTDTVEIKWTTASGPEKSDSTLGEEYLPPVLPRGFNVNLLPLLLVQVNIGLLRGVEVGLRYLPVFKLLGEKFAYWGAGIKLDLKKMRVLKAPFHLTPFFFYQSIRWGEFAKVDIISIDLIFCKTINLHLFTLTPYISPGIGFATARFSYGFKYTDPLTNEQKEIQLSPSFGYFAPKFSGGLRFRFPLMPLVGWTLVFNAIFTEFPSFSIGLGLTAR